MRNFPHSTRWRSILTKIHSRQVADSLIFRAKIHYKHLISGTLPYQNLNTSMTKELRNLIFPSLAMYRTLLEAEPDGDLALAEMEKLIEEDFFRGLGAGISMMNFLPNPFPVIRPVLRMMTLSQYPPGFQVLIEDNRDCFAINATRCFKLEVLTALNAGELTGLFCKTDDWLSAKLPKIHWLRTKTLARGDELCDFRWCRFA